MGVSVGDGKEHLCISVGVKKMGKENLCMGVGEMGKRNLCMSVGAVQMRRPKHLHLFLSVNCQSCQTC